MKMSFELVFTVSCFRSSTHYVPTRRPCIQVSVYTSHLTPCVHTRFVLKHNMKSFSGVSVKRHYHQIVLKNFLTFPPIPRHGDSPKISGDSRKSPAVVIWFAFAYPCVSTEDPEEQKGSFYIIFISIILQNIKRSSGSSGTSLTYTQLNQNTREDFLEKVFRFYA